MPLPALFDPLLELLDEARKSRSAVVVAAAAVVVAVLVVAAATLCSC